MLNPKTMENKKQFPDNEDARNEPTDTTMGSLMKHQYNVMPEDYRLMQCGQKPVSYSNYHSVVHQQLVQAPSTWAPISVQQLSHARVQSTDLISFHKQKPASAPASRLGSGASARSTAAAQQQQQQADNKKNSTNYQQLRSPSAKRPAHGTVTMQGWLYKQGSEGLKVWRKRWFVLSDYCLYYYKGPEEEKILGSILLPSYKVSLCTSKDKVYRKFAFKCEHANMRTYYLAAESEQAVMNWIQAVNLACTLQTNIEPVHQSNPSISSGCNTLKTTDSYHQHHHHQHQQHSHPQYNTFSHPHTPTPTPSVPVPVPVHHVQSHSNMSMASISYDFPCPGAGGIQPLYANAPPKPRRIGDGYSTPSPEFFLGDRYHGQCYSPYGMPEERCTSKNNNIYLKNCNNCTGYGTVGGNMYEEGVVTPVHCNHMYEQQVHTPVHRDQNVERRTPDTYGRAKLNSMKMKSDKSDYEDVYADEVIYKRPLSPVAYSNIKKVSPVASISVQHRPYMPVFSSAMPAPDVRISHKIRTPPIQSQAQQSDRMQHNTIPRPHSADFLDYEVKYRNVNKLNTSNCQQPRPKSSLDISRSATDNYYYSKETYAENMRKSALYMQQMPPQYHYSKENEHGGMMNGHGIYQKRKYLHETPPGARNMQHLASGSQDSLDITRSASPYAKSPCHLKEERTYSNHRVESLPRDRDREREREREREIEYHNEQFKRSASARLLRTPQEELYESVNKDGVQKREESMKRLLEWKQRMLQSPLNRKTSLGCSPHMVDRPDLYIRPVAHTHYPHHPQVPAETHRSYANVTSMPQYSSYSSDDEASGSIYMQHTSHETFPRAMAKKPWNSSTLTPSRSNKLTLPMRPSHSHDFDQSRASPYFYAQSPIPGTPLHQDDGHRNNVPNAMWQWSDRVNMTAGELLGRTHEELVLLLIQLRRQSTHTCHAIETCYSEIDNIQSQLNNMSAAKRSENLQKLEYLKQHLLELEKQYEKGKPLVNLVDNMVKLGSLYRNPNDQYYNTNVKDRLEFNQQIQEQRLLAEERKDWNRFNSNHTQLQSKVQQLYQLDRLLQEESGTLQCLQYDKEKIERALSGLRLQLNKGYKDPIEVEQARKQQIRLENELSRVHFMLAQNSKKLEETVAGNARLEQELLVLRQKLQLSRQHRSSAQFSNTGAGDSLPCAAGTSAMLEAELHRVQQLVGDLQRQRQELSVQVRQLTDRSHSLTQQIQPGTSHGSGSSCTTPMHHTITSGKKRITTLWRETDLDTMVSIDHGGGSDWDLGKVPSRPGSTEASLRQEEIQLYEDHNQQQNIEDIPQEKTEIKTVRIVKRESERRQRDKEKSSSISDNAAAQQKWDTVVEEVDDSFNNMYLPSSRSQINENTDNSSDSHMVDDNNHLLNRLASISSPSLYSQKGSYSADADSSIDDISIDKSPDLSPVFKSEAARQIIIEMSGGVASEPSTLKKCVRRTVPKEKRRHYTAPHNNLLSKSTFEIDNKVSVESRRARDDLDMERALRHRTDTPDVVRSTMNRKELKYNENTIDNILGTPNKINIPERYIPEQLPQLSVEEQRHRLRKVESIKKMLSDTILGSTSSSAIKSTENLNVGDKVMDATPLQKVTSKMVEEKRQREHLLQLNQILAKQVMEMSKIVAGSTNANVNANAKQ